MAAEKSIKIQFKADTDALRAGLSRADNDIQSFGDKLGRWADRAKLAFAAAAAAAGVFAVKLGKDAVMAASDFNETLSKTEVLFGDASTEIEKFADTAAQNFGQSKNQAMQAAATFATFGKAAGLAGQDLVGFSTGFVGLASDLASFNNTSPEQAINAIGAALRGESEPLRQYGVLINDAALKNAYFQLTGEEVSGSLTAQQKILAAQKLIYEQTTAAQGDFARTSDGLANQQRILSAEFANAKVELGQNLLPVALQFVQFLNREVIPAVKEWVEENGPKLKKMVEEVFVPTIVFMVSTLGTIVSWIADNKELLGSIGATIVAGLTVVKVTTAIQGLITLLGALATAYTGVATAAAAAGTATTTAAAAAGTAAAAGGGFAALASSLNIIAAAASAVVGGFFLVKKGIEQLIDAAEAWGKSYLMQLFGLGASGGTTPKTSTPVYTSNPNLMGLKGYTPGTATTLPTLPTVTLPPGGGGGGGGGGVSTAQQIATAERKLGQAIILQGQQIGDAARGLSDIILQAQTVVDKLAGTDVVREQQSRFMDEARNSVIEARNAADLAAAEAASLRSVISGGAAARESGQTVINFNAPVVSDPEALARLMNESLAASAGRTGNYTSLGFSTTSLPAAAI